MSVFGGVVVFDVVRYCGFVFFDVKFYYEGLIRS